MNRFFLIITFLNFLFMPHTLAASFKMSDIDAESSLFPGPGNQAKETSSTGGNFASLENYPTIKRETKPNYDEFALKNKDDLIKVTIQGSGRTFDDILIRESIDKNLETIFDVNVCIEDPILSTMRSIKKFNDSNQTNISKLNIKKILVSDNFKDNYIIINNSIYIKISRLGIGENIVYSYKVKSIRSGIYDISTLFRLNGSRWTDLENLDRIEIRPPEIEVYPEMDQSFAISGEPANITFNILHKSGWCNEDLDINMYLNKTDEYEIRYNGSIYNGEYLCRKLRPLEIETILLQLNYKEAGKHPIPMLHILGATVFQKNLEIEVKKGPLSKFLEDYSAIIYLIATLAGIFFSYYEFSKDLRNAEDRINNQINNQIHNLYTTILERKKTSSNTDMARCPLFQSGKGYQPHMAIALAGNWSFRLINSKTIYLTLRLFQSDNTVFGMGKTREDGNSMEVLASGLVDGDKLSLDVTSLGNISLYKLMLKIKDKSTSGSYRAFSTDGHTYIGNVDGKKE